MPIMIVNRTISYNLHILEQLSDVFLLSPELAITGRTQRVVLLGHSPTTARYQYMGRMRDVMCCTVK